MLIYLKYLIYLLEHKKNVFICCFKRGLYWHALTHDLSKFLPDEFIPYARFFYGEHSKEKQEQINKNFDKAWDKHKQRNKHHWESPLHKSDGNGELIMEEKHIKEMVCDLEAMALKFGDNAEKYFNKEIKPIANFTKKDLKFLKKEFKRIKEWGGWKD